MYQVDHIVANLTENDLMCASGVGGEPGTNYFGASSIVNVELSALEFPGSIIDSAINSDLTEEQIATYNGGFSYKDVVPRCRSSPPGTYHVIDAGRGSKAHGTLREPLACQVLRG